MLRKGREAAAAAKERQRHERQAVDREAAEAAAELLRKERQVHTHPLPSVSNKAEMRLHGTASPRALHVSAAAACVEGRRAL